MLGLDVIPMETEEGWAQFFKGLKNAGRKLLRAEWQRCKVVACRGRFLGVAGASCRIRRLCVEA